jgi:hypothetical protein
MYHELHAHRTNIERKHAELEEMWMSQRASLRWSGRFQGNATRNAEEEGASFDEKEEKVGRWRRVKKRVGGWMKKVQSK